MCHYTTVTIYMRFAFPSKKMSVCLSVGVFKTFHIFVVHGICQVLFLSVGTKCHSSSVNVSGILIGLRIMSSLTLYCPG